MILRFISNRVHLTAALAVLTATAFAAPDFYVAPDGHDTSPGTREQPFATLAKARDAARQQAPPGRIIVRGGSYFNVALVLEPEDSGLTIEAAPGEKPILYGGQPLKGWQKEGERFYAARLPEFPSFPEEPRGASPARSWDIRLLQVDGRMQPRARFLETGTLPHLTSFDVPWMSSTGGGWKRKPTHEELTTLKFRPGDLPPSLDVANAEVTIVHMWDESCVGVTALDRENQILTLSPEAGHPPGAFGVKKFIVWNTREGLTTPGQWYHDRPRGRLVYWPLPGQDMNRAEVIVPTVTTILRLRGRPEAKIKNVSVRGLAFSVTTVPLVAGGFAAARFDGAISLAHTENCTLSGLTVSRVAGHAINATQGAADTRVENCEVTDCGAGGIYVGGLGAVIRNNHVHGIGLAYPSAIGIFRGGRNCVVSHNEVHDCSYSAINYGGTDNVIEDNLLYDCMKVLHDGAAIYMFAATNCILRRNFARNITDTGGYGASAYYLDERSTGCVVENNLSLRVGWPTHNHMATNNVIRNNVFIVDGDAKLTFPRSTDYTLERNVLYATGKIRIEGINAVTNWSRNLFFSGANKVEGVPLKNYSAAAISEGAPGDTVLADPQLVDWKNGDYRFKPDSPAHKLGIQAIDVSRAGVSPFAFQPGSTNGEFTFDTGVLRGKLRAGGKSLGLSSVVHIPTGTVLDRSMGLFSHYRLFTTGQRYGGGVWDMPSRATLRADGSVEMTLPNAPDRPFEMRAIYRWYDAATLDLETVVKAERDLPGFEVFLASYFAPQFTNALIFATTGSEPQFRRAERSVAYWQMFVRDDAGVSMSKDGRWTFPPYPVEWTVCGRLGQPLAIRRAPELKLDAVLMAPAGDCFAIATPYETEAHYSMYLSLFGREIKAGETARAQSRLALRGAMADADIVRLYQSYVNEVRRKD